MIRWLRWFIAGPAPFRPSYEETVTSISGLAAKYSELEKRVAALETIEKLEERQKKSRALTPRNWTQTRAMLEARPLDPEGDPNASAAIR
jgi:hypothetical protein